MALDGTAIAKGCRGAKVTTARHLCRTQIETVSHGDPQTRRPLTIGCTQEAALFDEVAEEAGRNGAHRLRKCPRDGGLVARRPGCGTEDGGAAGGRG